VLWRGTVADATTTTRRNKGVWSSLGLGLSLTLSSDSLGDMLGETLGDIIAKYGARLRE
jgi:hypothetical protein